MADQRITQLNALPKAGVAATDVLPIADVSASETKKVTAKDLVAAGIDLVDNGEIDLAKLDQSSVTKLGSTALADDAVTAAKLANDSSIAVQTVTPTSDNFEGRGYFNSSTGNLQVFNGSAYQQVVMPESGIGNLQITNDKLANGAVTTAKIDALGLGTAALADDAVTYGKLQNTTSSNVLLGRSTAGAGNVEEIACTAAGRALLDDVDASAQRATLGLGTLATQSGTFSGTHSGTTSGTNTGDQTITLTGNVTGSGTGTFATTIAGGAVDETKLATNAVSTAKIAAGAVTSVKLAAGAVDATALGTGAVVNAKLGTGAVTYDKIQNVSATDRLLGRSSAGAGSIEEIPLTAAGRALLDDADVAAQRDTLGLGSLATQNGTFSGTFSGTSSGTNTGDQTITLTGDVTGSGTGTFAATISSGAITEAKLATDAVSTNKIANDAVVAAKLADNSAAIVAAAVPSGTGAFIGQQWINTATAIEYTWDGTQWLRQASLSTLTFVDTTPLNFSVAYPDPYSAEITTVLDNQTANRVLAGPSAGEAASPTFRALVPADLPDATSSTKGVVVPGSGLSISSGTLNHSNTVTAGTATKITFDAQGHVTAGASLLAEDIPNLDASKITTGTFGTGSLANDSVTAVKLSDYSTAQIGSTLPTADFIGQFFLNPLERTVYMWDGNVWQPVGITAGTVIFAGTYDANTNQIASVTADGAALGLSAGNPLPAASSTNQNYFVIVSNAGTGTSPAPTVAMLPPDLILSTGSSWVRIESSDAYVSQVATQVSFTPAGQIASTNVQAAIEEVSSECRNATNITSGTLATTVGGTGLTSYVKGDLIAGSGTNVLSKLAVGTNGFILKANSATATGLQWATYDALVTSGGTMTGNIALSSTAALVFEGSTEDVYETVLTAIDPTADHTVSLPNATGTLALTSDLDDGTY